MKKLGFTLSELLVALSIIAIASALVAPSLSNIMPDKNKSRVLKYYAMVKNYTHDMLSNEAIYYAAPEYFDENGNEYNVPHLSCNGLSCTAKPLISPYNGANDTTYVGNDKYEHLLRYMLFGSSTGTTMPDGSVWTISRVSNTDLSQGYTVVIDMDPNDSVNCTYNSTGCPRPDRFRFKVSEDGNITPGDALTDAYLRNPSNTSKNKDLAEAANLAASVTY